MSDDRTMRSDGTIAPYYEHGNLYNQIDRLRYRLAALEQRVIVREDVEAMGYEVPEWAVAWTKPDDGSECGWLGTTGNFVSIRVPDIRPDREGPVTLPIVSLRDE